MDSAQNSKSVTPFHGYTRTIGRSGKSKPNSVPATRVVLVTVTRMHSQTQLVALALSHKLGIPSGLENCFLSVVDVVINPNVLCNLS